MITSTMAMATMSTDPPAMRAALRRAALFSAAALRAASSLRRRSSAFPFGRAIFSHSWLKAGRPPSKRKRCRPVRYSAPVVVGGRSASISKVWLMLATGDNMAAAEHSLVSLSQIARAKRRSSTWPHTR